MELSILCANLPVLSTWLDDLVSGHNGVYVTAQETGFDLTEVSRRSRTGGNSKSRSRNKSGVEPASNPALRQGDGESDHGSQTGILKTTAFQLDHAAAEGVSVTAGQRQHMQVQSEWSVVS